MNALLHKYATQLTLGLFAVSAISGLFLFFHVGEGAFHEMHEWLSVALLAPFGLHVWKNWIPLINYLRRRTLAMPVLASFAVAAMFAVGGLAGGDDPPRFRAALMLTRLPIAQLAPLMQTSPAALQATLRQNGYPVTSDSQTLAGIAKAAHVQPLHILFQLLPED